MGLFGKKAKTQAVKHRPVGWAEIDTYYGNEPYKMSWDIWMPKFPLTGERDQCFLAQLVLVGDQAHLVMDGVDYGPVSEHATEAFDALNQYGGQSCPAVLRITKPTAANYHISVRKRLSAQTG